MRLSNEAMADTLEVFRSCLLRVERDYRKSSADHARIREWINESVYRLNPHTLFKPDMMDELLSSIFLDETVRTFVLDVQFRFYATAGSGETYLEDLCDTLEQALTIDGPVADYSRLPRVISENMPLAFLPGGKESGNHFIRWLRSFRICRVIRAVSVSEFLRSNPLLVTVLLLFLALEEPLEGSLQDNT